MARFIEHISKVHAPTATTTAGSTLDAGFERSSHSLLLSRLRLVAILGFFICIVMYLTKIVFLPLPETTESITGLSDWGRQLFHGHKISFAIVSLMLLWSGWSWRQLVGIDYIMMTFNIVVAIVAMALFHPAQTPDFGLALLLFIHAAFVPCRVAIQVGLALTAVIAYPLCQFANYHLFVEIQQFWIAMGGRELFQSHILSGTVDIVVIGILSTLVTRVLYRIRSDLRRAERFGNYIIQRELGSGGMGKVYYASHALLCRPTAIKVLSVEAEADRELAISRFEREVTLSSKLTHPNTITIFDYGRTRNANFYYAMEYLEGMDLQRLVSKFGQIPSSRVVFILKQVCGSLAEAHSRKIIHRDIKPSNIFLTVRGDIYDFVKVLDFGLAKEIKQTETATLQAKQGGFLGTPNFVAPELIHSKQRADRRADLYNLGAVAHWMLTAQPLFPATSSVEALVGHLKTVPNRPTELSELPVPQLLDDIVMRCLEKDPSKRFQSAEELSAALAAIHFERPWDAVCAKEWWELHGPAEEDMSSQSEEKLSVAAIA